MTATSLIKDQWKDKAQCLRKCFKVEVCCELLGTIFFSISSCYEKRVLESSQSRRWVACMFRGCGRHVQVGLLFRCQRSSHEHGLYKRTRVVIEIHYFLMKVLNRLDGGVAGVNWLKGLKFTLGVREDDKGRWVRRNQDLKALKIAINFAVKTMVWSGEGEILLVFPR